MAPKRADMISAKDLSRSINRAVALAVKRHKVKPEADSILLNWEIVGRILREVSDMNSAFDFASDVTKNLELRGIKADPAVARIGREILCGFIEKAGLPKQLPR